MLQHVATAYVGHQPFSFHLGGAFWVPVPFKYGYITITIQNPSDRGWLYPDLSGLSSGDLVDDRDPCCVVGIG